MARSRRSTGDTLEGSMLGSEMQSRSTHNATDVLLEPSPSAPRSVAHPPLSSSGRQLVDGRPPNLPSITDWNSTETPRNGPIKPTLSSLVSNFRFLPPPFPSASSSTRPFTAGPSRSNPGFSTAPRHPPPPRAVTQPQFPTQRLIPPIRSNSKSQPQPPLPGAVASPSMKTLTQPLYPPFARGPSEPIVHESQKLRCPEHMPNSIAPIHPAYHDPPDWQGQVPVGTRFHLPQVHPPPFYSLSSPESSTNSWEGLDLDARAGSQLKAIQGAEQAARATRGSRKHPRYPEAQLLDPLCQEEQAAKLAERSEKRRITESRKLLLYRKPSATIHWPSPWPTFLLAANFVPVPRVLDERDAPDGLGFIRSIGDLNSSRRPQLRQWYEYYHDNMGEADDSKKEVELLYADRETIDYIHPIFESTEIVDNSH
ncbi:hypothetical protein D1P53_002415 [Cryptococcus gattii VGV]|nr:hypothetical protein D1P53_002415 [Cryptococcus gattii VGV]